MPNYKFKLFRKIKHISQYNLVFKLKLKKQSELKDNLELPVLFLEQGNNSSQENKKYLNVFFWKSWK